MTKHDAHLFFAIYDTYDGSEPFRESEIKDFHLNNLEGLLAKEVTPATVEVKGGINYFVMKTHGKVVTGVWSYYEIEGEKQIELKYVEYIWKYVVSGSGASTEQLYYFPSLL